MRVLLLMPATTYRADAFIEAARRMGVDLLLASDRCHKLAVDSPAAERGALPLDLRDPEAAARAIVAHARERGIGAVVATDEATTGIAARASAALGFPHNPPEAVLAARDKRKLRAALERAGLLCPRWRFVPLDADLAVATRDLNYPVVLKPAALSGSQGVIRANDARELAAAFARIAALLRTPEVCIRADPALEGVLIESFVPGPEVAVEALLTGGALTVLAVFDKPDPLDGPFFEETLYVTPSRHPEAMQAAIAAATADAARALGLREGPVHAELRLGHPSGPLVIEVAARSIGGLCSRTLRFGAGLSLEEVILAHALGRGASLAREPRAAGVMMIPIPRAGFLRGFSGEAEARAVPGVEDVEVTHALDGDLVPLPEGDCYLGFIFARAATPAEVEAALREAHRRLRFDIATRLPAIDVRTRRG